MSSALILGDLHLGRSLSIGKPGIGTALNSRIIDQFNILDWVFHRALEYIVDNIIITGDVFEEVKPSFSVINLFLDWLKKCSDNDINVHIIAGNHDILRSGKHNISALDIIASSCIEGIFIYKHNITTIHTSGTSFTLMPFRDKRSFDTESNSKALQILQDKLHYELSEIDNKQNKVVIGHLAIEGSIPIGDEIDDMLNELICPISMFNGYDYVWMGHIHKPQVLNKKEPYVAHIGSMDISNFSENSHEKSIVIFDSKKGYKHIEIPVRSLNQINISVPVEVKDTTKYVIDELAKCNNLHKSIVRLNISINDRDAPNVDRHLVESYLNNSNVHHIYRIDEERRLLSIKKMENQIDNTVNEITAIKMFADQNIEENIRNDFIDLAKSVIEECSE